MKVPGIGEVKTPYVVAGGGFVLGLLGYAYYKNKKQSAANAAASSAASQGTSDGTGAGSDGIDPQTGVPYSQEGGAYGSTYGGINPATGLPYYDEITQSTTTGSSNAITTNAQWIQQAESDAQNLFGYTEAVATSGVGKFISQTNAGLQPNEYQMMQSVLADLGQPPTGGPYRLIQAPSSTGGGGGTTGGGKSLKVGNFVVNMPVAITPPKTVTSVANQFGISPQHLLNNNPGLTLSSKNVQVNVPVAVTPGTTFQALASRFNENVANVQAYLEAQGVTA